MLRRLSFAVRPLAQRSAVLLLAEVRSSRLLVAVPIAALVAGVVMAIAGLSPWLWTLEPFLGLGLSVLIATSALVTEYRPYLDPILRTHGMPRVPLLTSFGNRDAELAVRLDRARRGFENHNLSVLREIASAGLPISRRIDACLCLVDWHLAHRQADETLSWVKHISGEDIARLNRQQQKELIALIGELRAHLAPGNDMELFDILRSVPGGRGRGHNTFQLRDGGIAVANLQDPFDPCRAVERAVRRQGYAEVKSRGR